jgi:Arc/MetJ-type ribon-helix-helix transcriptional regulator
MKSNSKSSVTLPAEEVKLIKTLKSRLRLKSNVEVVRRGLRLLQETTDRSELRKLYRRASEAVRAADTADMDELDQLSGEGLD